VRKVYIGFVFQNHSFEWERTKPSISSSSSLSFFFWVSDLSSWAVAAVGLASMVDEKNSIEKQIKNSLDKGLSVWIHGQAGSGKTTMADRLRMEIQPLVSTRVTRLSLDDKTGLYVKTESDIVVVDGISSNQLSKDRLAAMDKIMCKRHGVDKPFAGVRFILVSNVEPSERDLLVLADVGIPILVFHV
jgi:hypothetical protein